MHCHESIDLPIYRLIQIWPLVPHTWRGSNWPTSSSILQKVRSLGLGPSQAAGARHPAFVPVAFDCLGSDCRAQGLLCSEAQVWRTGMSEISMKLTTYLPQSQPRASDIFAGSRQDHQLLQVTCCDQWLRTLSLKRVGWLGRVFLWFEAVVQVR